MNRNHDFHLVVYSIGPVTLHERVTSRRAADLVMAKVREARHLRLLYVVRGTLKPPASPVMVGRSLADAYPEKNLRC